MFFLWQQGSSLNKNAQGFISFIEKTVKQDLENPKSFSKKATQLFNQYVDRDTLFSRVLGRNARLLSREEKIRLEDLVGAYVSKIFSVWIKDGLSPNNFLLQPTGSKERGRVAIVYSHFKAAGVGVDTQVDWRLRKSPKTPEGFVIEDIIVSGISYTQVLRAEVEKLLRQAGGDVHKLVALLENKMKKND